MNSPPSNTFYPSSRLFGYRLVRETDDVNWGPIAGLMAMTVIPDETPTDVKIVILRSVDVFMSALGADSNGDNSLGLRSAGFGHVMMHAQIAERMDIPSYNVGVCTVVVPPETSRQLEIKLYELLHRSMRTPVHV